MASKVEWTIPESFAGSRIDKALVEYLQDQYSRSLIQKNIRDRHLWINGLCVEDVGYRVKTNDRCQFCIEVPALATLTPNTNIKLSILFEDEYIIAINKPERIPVHLGHGISSGTTLVEALLPHTNLSAIGGEDRPGVVHRLDQDTSGVILFAKTDAAYWVLTRLFAKRLIHKIYHALAWGIPALKSGEIDVPIGRSAQDRTKMCITTRGRSALTRWNVLEAYPQVNQSLLACYPLTGRTHQIRVHLKHIGHRIVGDPKYGKIPDVRLFLHAYAIEFIHPFTQKHCRIVAPWPVSFEDKFLYLRQKERSLL